MTSTTRRGPRWDSHYLTSASGTQDPLPITTYEVDRVGKADTVLYESRARIRAVAERLRAGGRLFFQWPAIGTDPCHRSESELRLQSRRPRLAPAGLGLAQGLAGRPQDFGTSTTMVLRILSAKVWRLSSHSGHR